MTKTYLRTTPVHKRGHETIEKILNAAEAAFIELGYDKTTTRIIASRAQVPAGSLYHFFPNKKAILDGLAARHLRAQKDMHQYMASFSPNENLEKYVDALVEKIAEHFEMHAPFERIIFMPSSSPEIAEYVQRFNEETLKRTRRIMAIRFPDIASDVLDVLSAMSVVLVRSLLNAAAHQTTEAARTTVKHSTKLALHAVWASFVKQGEQKK